ncbi:hypothetical protein ACHAPQ_011161 [Fusarium lateritium]
MASQPGPEFPPDTRVIVSPPSSGFILPGDAIEDRLEKYDLPSLDVPLDQILGSAHLLSRDNVEFPELSDSDSDDQPITPPRINPNFFAYSISSHRDERVTVIGGAVVRNVCLVVPDITGKGFADFPVQPIQASHGKPAQLVATILDDKKQKPPMPFLIMPQEHDSSLRKKEPGPNLINWSMPTRTSSTKTLNTTFSGFIPWTMSALKKDGSDIAKVVGKIDEEAKKDKLGKAELDHYVLSGDIDNFWGIKGLTVKLYKYNGGEPGKDSTKSKDGADPTSGPKEASREDTEAKTQSTKSEPVSKPEEEEAKVEEKDSKDKDTKEDKDAEKKDKKKDAPVMEKIKLNTDNVHHKSKPLGTLFSFINNETFKNLPVENIEIIYSEDKNNLLYKPGLRLELDVPLKGGLAWAGDALKNLFDPKDPPKVIHLSAHLSDTRDWSKAPKIENLILQGSLPPLSPKKWDMVSFKTLGIEITATKAAKGKAKEDKSKEKKADDEKSIGDKSIDDGSGGEEDDEAKDDQVVEPDAAAADSVVEGDEEGTKGSTEAGANEEAKEEKDSDKDEKKEKKDDKPKEEKSWYYGFAFFGTLALTNIPHANAPLEMNYRIARDFVPPKKVKKDEDKDKKSDKKEQDNEKDETRDGSDDDSNMKAAVTSDVITKDDTKSLKKTDKLEKDVKEKTKKKKKDDDKDSKHKRSWNMVIKADKWKDIYGIKNLTMSKAELTTSFNEGEFWASIQLELSAEFKLGDGNFKAKGHFSRKAEVGDLTLTDIRKIHDQMQGKKLIEDDTESSKEKGKTKDDEEKQVTEKKKKEEEKTDEEKEEEKKVAAGNEITFNEVKLKLSRKKLEKEETIRNALELNGKVTFNEHACSTASLIIATDGLSITGGISDFKIPGHEVVIQRAGLEIFIAFKGNGDSNTVDKKKDGDDTKETKEVEVDKAKKLTKSGEKAEEEESPKKDDDEGQEKADKKPPSDKASTDKKKKKKAKRASRFGILGVVKIHTVTVEVGFYTEQKKDSEKREWLAFGAAKTIRLTDIWKEIEADSFLNLQLDNVALIASSEERKMKKDDDKKDEKEKDSKKDKDGKDKKSVDKADNATEKNDKKKKPKAATNVAADVALKDEKTSGKDKDKDKDKDSEDKKDEKKEEKGDEQEEEEEEKKLDTWDVLGTVDAYNYPIVKGVQLCTTISSFTQLESLNGGKKIDGLQLIISYTSQGKFGVSMDIPPSFKASNRMPSPKR